MTLVVWYPQSQEAQEFLQIYITMRQNQASRAVTSLHTSSGPCFTCSLSCSYPSLLPSPRHQGKQNRRDDWSSCASCHQLQPPWCHPL